MRDAAQSQPRLFDPPAFELERRRDRHEREGIREAVADFEISVVRSKAPRRKFDRGHDLVVREVSVALRRVAGQPMEIGKRNCALPSRPCHMYLGFEGGERHTHVGGMRGDTSLAGAEDGVHAVEAVDGRAAAAGLALVAW